MVAEPGCMDSGMMMILKWPQDVGPTTCIGIIDYSNARPASPPRA